MPRKSPKAASPQAPGGAASITHGIGLGAATGKPAAGGAQPGTWLPGT